VRAHAGSVRWRVRARSIAHSHAAQQPSDLKKRKRACVNSAHRSYNGRIRLLDKMFSLYVEKKKRDSDFRGLKYDGTMLNTIDPRFGLISGRSVLT
jgi:hypothetical protein